MSPRHDGSAKGQAPRVLWAEDSREDQQLVLAALDDAGAQRGVGARGAVTFVGDGAALLERLRTQRPALVVLDLNMPRMGGIEALRRLRGDPRTKGMRVAIFSSSRRPEEVAACEDLGAVAFVQKPLDFGGMQAAVGRLMELAAEEPDPTAPEGATKVVRRRL